MADPLAGYNNLLERKQAELRVALENKTETLKPAAYTQEYDLPTLEDRLRRVGQPIDQPRTGTPDYMDMKYQASGLEYMANIPGSFIHGVGQLDNAVLTAPQTIVDILDGTGANQAAAKFIEKNYPQYSANFARAGKGVRMATGALDELGNLIEEGTSYFANSDETTALHDKVSRAYDDNSGAVNIAIAMATTVATNPAAIPEIIAQSLPMMAALGKEGSVFALTFTGMVGQRIDDAQEKYQKIHGKLAEGNDFNRIAMGAVAATAIETLESRFLLSKHSKIAKAVKDKTARIRGVPGINTAIKTAQGAAAEAFEEGSAEYITQLTGMGKELTLENLLDPESVKEGAVAAAIGGGPGAAIKGGVQVLPDTAKVAQKGAKKVAEGIELAVTTNNAKRLKNAQKRGDTLAVLSIGLEKDITKLKDTNERITFLKFLSEQQMKAEEEIDAMEANEDKSEAIEELAALDKKLSAATQVFSDLLKKEKEEKTTLEAETIINTEGSTAEETIEAVNTIVADIQQGKSVTDKTIAKILGSASFETLSKEDKEVLKLAETVSKAEKKTRSVEGSKTMKEVAADIFSGNTKDRFIGTEQQRKIVASAIALGDKKKAVKSLSQLVALRTALVKKLKEPSRGKDGKVYKDGKHSPAFVKQVSSEIESITATLALLNVGVTTAFGGSPLSAEQLAAPTVELYSPDGTVQQTPKAESKATPTTGPFPDGGAGVATEQPKTKAKPKAKPKSEGVKIVENEGSGGTAFHSEGGTKFEITVGVKAFKTNWSVDVSRREGDGFRYSDNLSKEFATKEEALGKLK
jgi:hypothetical protein